MKTEIEMLGKLELALLLQLIMLVIVVTADTYLQKKQKKTLLLIIVMAFSLVVQDGWTSLPDGRTDGLLRTLAEIYGCSDTVVAGRGQCGNLYNGVYCRNRIPDYGGKPLLERTAGVCLPCAECRTSGVADL